MSELNDELARLAAPERWAREWNEQIDVWANDLGLHRSLGFKVEPRDYDYRRPRDLGGINRLVRDVPSTHLEVARETCARLTKASVAARVLPRPTDGRPVMLHEWEWGLPRPDSLSSDHERYAKRTRGRLRRMVRVSRFEAEERRWREADERHRRTCLAKLDVRAPRTNAFPLFVSNLGDDYGVQVFLLDEGTRVTGGGLPDFETFVRDAARAVVELREK